MTQGEEHRQSREWERGFLSKVDMDKYMYRILFGMVVVALGTGTVVYHFLEGWSWVDSFYFSSVAVTTVGFGDLTPTRDVSKLFTVLYIFSGIGIISAFIDHRLKRHSGRIATRRSRNRRK